MKKVKTKQRMKQYNKNNNKRKLNDNQLKNNSGVFDTHIKYEFEEKDVDKTMKTMANDPYVHHVPILTGGVGYEGVRTFYSNSFVGKMPNDTKFVRISRTVGKDQVVDELITSFTHDIEIPVMLPGIPPTGKYIEFPIVVIMKFKGNKIAHEHIYWDQASLLTQIGLLDKKTLPIVGIEQSKKLQELSLSHKKIQKKKAMKTIAKAKT